MKHLSTNCLELWRKMHYKRFVFGNSSNVDCFASVESLLIASIWCYFIINDSLNYYLLKTVFLFVFQFNLIPLDDAVTKEVHEEFYQKLNLDLDALRSSLKQLNDSNDPQSSASHKTQISFVGLFAVVVLLFYSCWRFYWNYCLIFKILFLCTSFFSLIVRKSEIKTNCRIMSRFYF